MDTDWLSAEFHWQMFGAAVRVLEWQVRKAPSDKSQYCLKNKQFELENCTDMLQLALEHPYLFWLAQSHCFLSFVQQAFSCGFHWLRLLILFHHLWSFQASRERRPNGTLMLNYWTQLRNTNYGRQHVVLSHLTSVSSAFFSPCLSGFALHPSSQLPFAILTFLIQAGAHAMNPLNQIEREMKGKYQPCTNPLLIVNLLYLCTKSMYPIRSGKT
jgi:hypothetical protein